jgi:DNA-binding NarL/FixJ family response regulator
VSIRVVLVDDQPIVRSGIALLLASVPDIEVVAEAGDGLAAVSATRTHRPDVVIMDVQMPGMGGVEATSHIAARTRVLVLTAFHVDEAVYDALRAGAAGFLLKDAAPADLPAAVRAVARGDAWLDPPVAARLVAEFAQHKPDGERSGGLTDREREVVRLIAHGLSNVEIASALVVTEGTVKTHINRIFGKLHLRDRAQAVSYAFRTGLVRADEGPWSGTA